MVVCNIGSKLFKAATIKNKKRFFISSSLAFLTSVVLIIISIESNAITEQYSHAIIMSESAYIKSAPNQQTTTLFLLHEGTKVEIVEEISDWKKVKIANGNSGWINNADLATI